MIGWFGITHKEIFFDVVVFALAIVGAYLIMRKD